MTKKSSKAPSSWFDEASNTPVIDEQARRLDSFLAAMADGVIDESELHAQEARVAELMKEVEPLLSDEVHDKVTRLLCEMTAYDLMRIFHAIQEARPKTVFRG
jgi:predicted thioredoxin/glutaredoxin